MVDTAAVIPNGIKTHLDSALNNFSLTVNQEILLTVDCIILVNWKELADELFRKSYKKLEIFYQLVITFVES